MARRRGRRGHRAYHGLSGFLRSLPEGFAQVGLATGVMGVGAAIASALKGSLVINATVGGSTVSLDLGFIPGVAVTFAGLFMFLMGLRKMTRTRV